MESVHSKLIRFGFNLLFPAYRRTGAKVTYVSKDFYRVTVRLPSNWKTRTILGTTFGGAMYAAIDPIYVALFIKHFKKRYIIWDKEAHIRYKIPVRTTLFAYFEITPDDINQITRALEHHYKIDRLFHVDLMDKNGEVHASFEKIIHFRNQGAEEDFLPRF